METNSRTDRREFLRQAIGVAGAMGLTSKLPAVARGAFAAEGPDISFPAAPRDRISVASYPFREFIAGRREEGGVAGKMAIKDFGAHVAAKFGVRHIEPWSAHFSSLEPDYLAELSATLAAAGVGIANIAVDGKHSPYAPEKNERAQAIAFCGAWIDAAAAIHAPGIRTNIPRAKAAELNVERAAETLRQIADYGASRNIVVNLENDNPVSEDPYFLVNVIEKAGTPWLRALPDFGNTLTAHPPPYAYDGLAKMFAHAYGICHVKAMEEDGKGDLVHVDLDRAFSILRASGFRGYCSMEFDSPGDPYAGTRDLIQKSLKALAAS
ncbi:MAG TPA: sugar phosphate isomerase/epimerase family protein [Candidatus Acidoferrum sp.]|nr:sugar phosphate isomerase/epimerase family protein [Candidatus Acidoferrum sp.]